MRIDQGHMQTLAPLARRTQGMCNKFAMTNIANQLNAFSKMPDAPKKLSKAASEYQNVFNEFVAKASLATSFIVNNWGRTPDVHDERIIEDAKSLAENWKKVNTSVKLLQKFLNLVEEKRLKRTADRLNKILEEIKNDEVIDEFITEYSMAVGVYVDRVPEIDIPADQTDAAYATAQRLITQDPEYAVKLLQYLYVGLKKKMERVDSKGNSPQLSQKTVDNMKSVAKLFEQKIPENSKEET